MVGKRRAARVARRSKYHPVGARPDL